MFRRALIPILVVAIAGSIAGPVEAKKKPRPKAVTYFLNWAGDCAGGGYLSLKSVPNEGTSCALFFNTQSESLSFPATEGLPLLLDATKPITLDFDLTNVVQATAEYEAVLTSSIKGDRETIATATQTVTAQALGSTAVHFDLEPDAALNRARMNDLNLTINLKSGVSYSTLDVQSGTAQLEIHGLK